MFETILFPVLVVLAIGLVAAVVLSVASKFMAVQVDERFTNVREELPGANCGACGYTGCDAYAQKVVEGEKTNLCVPGGAAVAKKLSELMGVAFEEAEARRAIVHCSGICEYTEYVMDYQGPKSCAACNSFYQGRGSCSHACLGYGDCAHVCPYGAISMVDGIAHVDSDLCVGCGMCTKACPNNLLTIVPASSAVFVGCSSTDKGAYTRKICKAGCIGCKKCEKTCPNGAVKVENNLAAIDPYVCTGCGACVEQCPTGAIKFIL